MNIDPNKLADAAAGIGEAAKLAGNVYGDLASPSAKEVGATVGLSLRAVLLPARGALWAITQVEEWLGAAVQERIRRRSIPDDRLRTPDPQIYGGIAVGMVTCGNVPELREMFANLLATAVDSKTASKAHPAFAEIIRQMTPDEAELLRMIAPRGSLPSASVKVRTEDRNSVLVETGQLLDVPTIPTERQRLIPSYVNNLCRLGLLEVPPLMVYVSDESYQTLDQHPLVVSWRAEAASQGFNSSIQHAVVRVTEFGKQFEESCILDDPLIVAARRPTIDQATSQPEVG